MKVEETSHAQLSAELIDKHRVLIDLIGGRPFHYVDIPMHGNVGDLLIMLGTLEFFGKAGLVPRLISPCFSFNLDWIGRNDVVVFHGGGNFGDLYPYYQALRERVARAKPGNRIIVLPQSIHFSSPENASRSAKFFRSHPDLHLCVRDQVSFELAREFTDKVYLLPDMAHQLYPLVPPVPVPTKGPLWISRVDDEKQAEPVVTNFEAATQTDWPEFVGARERTIARFRRVHDALARRRLGWLANRLLSPLWIRYSKTLMLDAARLFGAHKTVVSDRLHGHILAFVMSKPSTLIDNRYGKNGRYAKAWTAASELVTLQLPPQQKQPDRRRPAHPFQTES